MGRYCKRLIEVDMPIERISAHARSEKNIKDSHISSLHIWWARRPLAACRAVICASLWPDPVDELCPDIFRQVAREQMIAWSKNHLRLVSAESASRFVDINKNPSKLTDLAELRIALFDFIADFASWKNSKIPEYMETSRLLTQVAHEALGAESGTKPVLLDPFAGGGAIPLEALRVGATACASDLNSLPILLNKVILEFLPKHGLQLVDQVRISGNSIRIQLEEQLTKFYGADPNSEKIPFSYFWGRTIDCEGPACGYQYPLIRSLTLKQKGDSSITLKLIADISTRKFKSKIMHGPVTKKDGEGTSRLGAATCPACNYTTPVEKVRTQLSERKGGANDAQLLAICETQIGRTGKTYRTPTANDIKLFLDALHEYHKVYSEKSDDISIIPDEELNHLRGFFNVVLYGMTTWGDLFAPRQALLMTTLVRLIKEEFSKLAADDQDLAVATTAILSLIAGKVAQYNSSCCRWKSKGETLVDMFGRQAIPMVWDFAEAFPFGKTTGDFGRYVNNTCKILEHACITDSEGVVLQTSATKHPLPDDSCDAFITDPPYYDAIPYADLSDYFYVWLRRILGGILPDYFPEKLSPKNDECVVLAHRAAMYRNKDNKFFEEMIAKAMSEGRRITRPTGIAVVVFANKSTMGWEAMLSGLIGGGWIITGSWPIDTEMGSRLRAQNSAVLASSVHIVCRPRENPDGSLQTDRIGDWRTVLDELPNCIHKWMPRLAEEGVVGADAIFACLGPALEIFSQYSSVEKVSGERIELSEYLEEVWAAVSREALNMIFDGADASGFEEDARLTAMWLWTLRTATNVDDEETDEGEKIKNLPGYSLEFDAARKIAQGLGVHLENLSHLVEVKGDTAILFSAGARSHYLFGKDSTGPSTGKKKKKASQQTLFDFEEDIKNLEDDSNNWVGEISSRVGGTVLDHLHQSMILFAASRGEAMKRLLVEEGVGQNPQFWRLAQAFSALYLTGTDDKRWVDGVLARKKGLGF
jgi:putative DNA methylase